MQRCVVMTHKNLLSFCFWRCRLTNEAVVTYCVITFAHHVTCSWNWRPGGVGQWLIIRTNSEKKDTNICSTPNKWKKGTSVECSRLNEKLKRITSLYVTHLKSSARSVHETVHPHISFQPSIMTRMRSPNANGNNKNTKEMKHCWEHAVSDRISEGKKNVEDTHSLTIRNGMRPVLYRTFCVCLQQAKQWWTDPRWSDFRISRWRQEWGQLMWRFRGQLYSTPREKQRGRPTTWAALGHGSLTMHSDNYVVRTHRQP